MEAIAIPSALDRILYKLGSEDQAAARQLIDEMMGRGPSGAGYAGGEAVGRYWGTRLRAWTRSIFSFFRIWVSA